MEKPHSKGQTGSRPPPRTRTPTQGSRGYRICAGFHANAVGSLLCEYSYVFHVFQKTSQGAVFCPYSQYSGRIPHVFLNTYSKRRPKKGRIPYKIFLAPRIHIVGFSEALMACLGLAPVSLFWGRDFVKLLAQSAWVLSVPLLCLDLRRLTRSKAVLREVCAACLDPTHRKAPARFAASSASELVNCLSCDYLDVAHDPASPRALPATPASPKCPDRAHAPLPTDVNAWDLEHLERSNLRTWCARHPHPMAPTPSALPVPKRPTTARRTHASVLFWLSFVLESTAQ